MFTVAPGKGQKPVSILNDQHFEGMCNPTMYPTGRWTCIMEKKPRLIVRISSSDCLMLMEDPKGHQVLADTTVCSWKQASCQHCSEADCTEDKCSLKELSGTSYWHRKGLYLSLQCKRFTSLLTESDVWYYAWDEQATGNCNTVPHFLISWHAVARYHPDNCQRVWYDEDMKPMSFEEKSKWLRQNPVTAAGHFHYCDNTFFQVFLKSTVHPPYWSRIPSKGFSSCSHHPPLHPSWMLTLMKMCAASLTSMSSVTSLMKS